MSLTFFYAPMSTASTVHWTLLELGIPYEGVLVDLKNEADKKAKLASVNPNLKVPVLVHDGVPIFESAAIQIYLGETFGVDKGLYPAPGPKRGLALKWLVWANVSLGDAVRRWHRNAGQSSPEDQRNAAAGKAARAEIDQLIGLLDTDLGKRSYILGEDISIVDFHLAAFFQWLQKIGVDMAPFPRVAAWLARSSARPALAKLMAG
jgi:glutathione S-transferase